MSNPPILFNLSRRFEVVETTANSTTDELQAHLKCVYLSHEGDPDLDPCFSMYHSRRIPDQQTTQWEAIQRTFCFEEKKQGVQMRGLKARAFKVIDTEPEDSQVVGATTWVNLNPGVDVPCHATTADPYWLENEPHRGLTGLKLAKAAKWLAQEREGWNNQEQVLRQSIAVLPGFTQHGIAEDLTNRAVFYEEVAGEVVIMVAGGPLQYYQARNYQIDRWCSLRVPGHYEETQQVIYLLRKKNPEGGNPSEGGEPSGV